MLTYSGLNTHGYPTSQSNGGISVSGSTLTAYGPTSGLGKQYSVDWNLQSVAQGKTKSLPITASNLITVGNTLNLNTASNISSVTSTFQAGPSLNITSVVISSLDASKSYQVTAASNMTNIYECAGDINTADQYNNCNPLPVSPSTNLLYSPDSNGKISILWWSSSGYPPVTSLTLTASN